jgi:hypothetical protein
MESYLLPILIGSLILALILLASLWQSRHRLGAEYAAELTDFRTRNSELEIDFAVERVHASRVPGLEDRLAKLAEQADGQKSENAALQGELAKSLATNEAG